MTHAPAGHKKGSWPDLGTFWTLPNVLSMSRFVLALPLAYLIYTDAPLSWLMTVFFTAVATDFFDGKLARWSKAVSDWGKVLDPLADKFSGIMVMVALVLRGSLPVWFLGVLLVRDVLIVWGGTFLGRRTGMVLMSLWSGKIAVAALALTVLAAIPQIGTDQPVIDWLIGITTVLMIVSWFRYLVRFIRVWRALGEKDELDAILHRERAASAVVQHRREVVEVASDYSGARDG